tara:strand:+ start:8043 stop:8429 length:387 start_codon:yes stop_codon:yes gene_type:complete
MAAAVVSDNFETSTGAIPNLGGADVTTRLCSAWVNFNGTGTVAIRASYNVSSIVDNAVGDYTINFTTAMVDASYSVSGLGSVGSAGTGWGDLTVRDNSAVPTASALRLGHIGNSSWTDCTFGNVQIFR